MQRQVTFVEAIKMGFDKYCCFTGRASRSEYWWWVLFTFLVGLVLGMFGKTGEILSGIATLAFLLPGLGLVFRRLHDIGKPGWFILLGLIPIVGAIILIIWFVKDSEPVANQYGPVPNMVGGDDFYTGAAPRSTTTPRSGDSIKGGGNKF